ncbi:hypothetical protein GAYE_FCTG49G0023 [Galdieria yellowstonensis]|uniref:Uncharacterized protein n=1 Tax=Galdieria yellowstonensis TaxID=3028027 RepID=A0AAV9I2R0_9RHOD|nr:hypothetical protein GAYE_FCTG49G0023 [Galdieria yellowstonensis]
MLRSIASKLRGANLTVFTRSFCSATSSSSSTSSGDQGSSLGSSVASRYAYTLLSLARKEGILEKVTNDVKQFRTFESDHPDFKRFLQDPTVPKGEKQQLLRELLKREQFSDLFQRFVGVVEENRRLENLSSIVGALDNMLRGDKGQRVAYLVTARPLTEWQICFLRKRLIRRFFPDDPETELDIHVKQDPSLISGFTVQVGERFIDLSYRKEMRDMLEALRQS